MNGADILCDTLVANNVTVCFANPGTSEMHFVAALDHRPDMRCVLGLFEGVVTGAADGYGRMLDRPAATLLHLGFGLANGVANLHNAKRARSPIVNIVGDHATYHAKFDAPLHSDVVAVATPMSDWVDTCNDAQELSNKTAQAISEATCYQGKIATLILPADVAWAEVASTSQIVKASKSFRSKTSQDNVTRAANAIRSKQNTVLILGGDSLREKPLEVAGQISLATGVSIITETSNKRVQRGAGCTPIGRLPFPIDASVEMLSKVQNIVLIGAGEPIAYFAYPGRPSKLYSSKSELHVLATYEDDLLDALERLASELGISREAPRLINRAAASTLPPSGTLNGDAITQTIASLMPENAIICDESISQGRSFGKFSEGSPKHDWLQLTGGAIGQGLPLATGAAVACPERKVISIQADGSAMYTLQALWTQARENLNCLTVILANRSYGTLHLEMKKVGATAPGRNARLMLDIDQPNIDWVHLAKGMGVEAVRVTTIEDFIKIFREGLRVQRPFLIEACI
jgi:acetolactate synthase-1/2/3 large subunit